MEFSGYLYYYIYSGTLIHTNIIHPTRKPIELLQVGILHLTLNFEMEALLPANSEIKRRYIYEKYNR